MSKIKIIHIISNLGIGGAETVLYELASHLPNTQFDQVIIYFRHGYFVHEFQKLGIPTYEIRGFFFRYDPTIFLRLYLLLKKLQPDCLHTVLWAANFLGKIIARVLKIPQVSAIHNNVDQNGFLRIMLDRATVYFCQHTIAVSQTVAESLNICIPRMKQYPVQVINNGIDQKTLLLCAQNDLHVREEFGLEKNTFVVGSVGRFVAEKNFSFLLKSFSLFCRKYSDTQLIIMGDGPEEKKLKNLAQSLGIEKKVIFLTGKRSYGYYGLFDCFVLPSYKEGIAMALLEAMSFEVPCIVSSESLSHDLIVSEKNGLLVFPGNVLELYNALVRMKENDMDRLLFLKQGKKTVLDNFSLETMIHSYATTFSNISSRTVETKFEIKI